MSYHNTSLINYQRAEPMNHPNTSPIGNQGAALTNIQGAALNNIQVAALTNIHEATPADIQRAALANIQGAELMDTQGAALTNIQGAALANIQGAALMAIQGAAPTDTQGASLTNIQGAALNNIQGAAPTVIQGAALTDVQVAALNKIQGSALTDIQVAALMAIQGAALTAQKSHRIETDNWSATHDSRQRWFYCYKCYHKPKFASQELLNNHLASWHYRHYTESASCGFCKKSFDSISILSDHIKIEHESVYYCVSHSGYVEEVDRNKTKKSFETKSETNKNMDLETPGVDEKISSRKKRKRGNDPDQYEVQGEGHPSAVSKRSICADKSCYAKKSKSTSEKTAKTNNRHKSVVSEKLKSTSEKNGNTESCHERTSYKEPTSGAENSGLQSKTAKVKDYVCSLCEESFSSPLDLTCHKLTHLKDTKKSSKVDISGDCEEVHTQSVICSQPEKLLDDSTQDRNEAVEVEDYECNICGVFYLNLRELNLHKLTHLKNTNATTQANVSNKQKERRARNKTDSQPVRLVEENRTRFSRGKKNGEVVKGYECKICQKTYSNQNDLTIHKLSHLKTVKTSSRVHVSKDLKESRTLDKILAQPDKLLDNGGGRLYQDKKKNLSRPDKKSPTNDTQKKLGTDCEICGVKFKNLLELTFHKLKHVKNTKKPSEDTEEHPLMDKFRNRKRRKTWTTEVEMNDISSGQDSYHENSSVQMDQYGNYLENRSSEMNLSGIIASEQSTNQEGENETCVWTCSQCDLDFDRMSKLQEHLNTEHSDLLQYRCPACGDVFDSDDHVRLHLRAVHTNWPPEGTSNAVKILSQPDAQVLYSFDDPSGTPEKFFSCDRCSKLFLYEESLKEHKIVHDSGASMDTIRSNLEPWQVVDIPQRPPSGGETNRLPSVSSSSPEKLSNDEFEGYIPAPAITEQPNDVNEVSPSGVVVKQEIDCLDDAYDAVTMATDEVPNQLLVNTSPPGGKLIKQEIDSSQEIKYATIDEVPIRLPVNAAPSSGVIGELGIDSPEEIKDDVDGVKVKQEIDSVVQIKDALTIAKDEIPNQLLVRPEIGCSKDIKDDVTMATGEMPNQLQVKPDIATDEIPNQVWLKHQKDNTVVIKDVVPMATRPSGHSQENSHLVPRNPQVQRDDSSHVSPIPDELNPLDLTLTNTRPLQSSSNLPPFMGYGHLPYVELTPGRGYPPRVSANHSQIPSSSGMTPFMGNWHRPIGEPRETAPPLTHGSRLPNDDSGQNSGQRTMKDKGRFPSETRVGGSSVPHGTIVSPNMGSGSIIPPYMGSGSMVPPYMGGGSMVPPYMGSWEHGQVVEISPHK